MNCYKYCKHQRTQAIALITLLLDNEGEKENTLLAKKRENIYVKPWLQKQLNQGSFYYLLRIISFRDLKSFKDWIGCILIT